MARRDGNTGRRRARRATIACATTGLVAGIGLVVPADAGASVPEPSGEDVTLRWSMWAGADDEPLFEEMAALVTAEYPNITIEFEPSTFEDHFSSLVRDAATGNLACIAGIQNLRLAGVRDAFMPLDGFVESTGFDMSDFNAGIVEGMTQDGSLYAFPYDTGPTLIYYNKDAFADAGLDEPALDWSIDDFVAAAEALTNDDMDGVSLAPGGLYAETLTHAYNGSWWIDEAGEIDLENPDVIAALEWYAGLVHDLGVAPEVGGADYNPLTMFRDGDVAMTVGGPWDAQGMIEAELEFEFGVVPPPGGVAATAGSGFGVTATCEHPAEAFQALTVLTGPEALGIIAAAGRGLPARMSQLGLYYENFPVLQPAVDQALAIAEPFRSTVLIDALDSQFGQFFPSAINGEISVDEAVADILAAIGE